VPCCRAHVGYLPPRMHTRVSPSREMPPYSFARQLIPGAFEFSLHCAHITLEL
jgi:hypothetical protein